MTLNRDLINFSDEIAQADSYVAELKSKLSKTAKVIDTSRLSSTIYHDTLEIARAEGELDGLIKINKATTDLDKDYVDIIKAIFDVMMGGTRSLLQRDPVDLAYLDGRRFAANLAMKELEASR